MPKCFGGFEAGPVEALAVIEAVSEADGSTGWVLMACNVGTGSAADICRPRAPTPSSASTSRSSPAKAARAGAPCARARAIRLTGRWSYGSGVLHTEYLHTGGMVMENGKPKEARTFIVPTKQSKFLGNWDVLGLNGTGSIDYGLEDVYVPEEMTHSPNLLEARQGGSLYRLGIVGMSPLGHTGLHAGIGPAHPRRAEGARPRAHGAAKPARRVRRLDELPGEFRRGRSEIPRRARLLLRGLARRAAEPRPRRALHHRGNSRLMRLSLNHVTTAVMEIATFAHRAGGGVALRSGILQRCFRDMFGATQHRIVSANMLGECGRELLGLAEGKIWHEPRPGRSHVRNGNAPWA